MSLMLLFCRWALHKNVYLLAVGYYNSATSLGRLSAWCAAKAATGIVARDEETYQNFARLQSQTVLDRDIAWRIKDLDLHAYQADLAQLEKTLPLTDKTLFITVRRFRGGQTDKLNTLIQSCLEANPDKPIIVGLLEPRHVDPAGYRQLRAWQRQFRHIQIVDCGFNPLALYLYFQKYHDKLAFIGPQFHGILTAHLHDVPYLPLAYDNKVHNLLRQIAPHRRVISIHELSSLDLQRFIDQFYSDIPHRRMLQDSDEQPRALVRAALTPMKTREAN